MTKSPLVFTCHGDVASCHSERSAFTWKMAPIVAIWMGNIYTPVPLFRVWRNRGAQPSSFAPFFLCTIFRQVLILQRVLTIVLSLGCSYAAHCKLPEVCLISTKFRLLNLCVYKSERTLGSSLFNIWNVLNYWIWLFILAVFVLIAQYPVVRYHVVWWVDTDFRRSVRGRGKCLLPC